jgi:hypothetical protein
VNTNDQSSCKNVLTKTTLHIGIKLAPWQELWKCSVKAPATMGTRIASDKNLAVKCQGKPHALAACSSDFTALNYFFFSQSSIGCILPLPTTFENLKCRIKIAIGFFITKCYGMSGKKQYHINKCTATGRVNA